MEVITLLYEICFSLGVVEWWSDFEWLVEWLSELLNSTLFAMVIRELALSVTSELGVSTVTIQRVGEWRHNLEFRVYGNWRWGVLAREYEVHADIYIWVIAHFNTALNVRLGLQRFLTLSFPLKMRDNLGDGTVIILRLKWIGYEDGTGKGRDILQLWIAQETWNVLNGKGAISFQTNFAPWS